MLNIIIIDDDTHKSGKIRALFAGENISVYHSQDVITAKRLMKSTRFDLAIVDIALPLRLGDQPKETAGIELVRELCSRPDTYLVPRHIVGLTGHSSLLDEAQSEFSRELWTVLFFDYNSDIWEQQLLARVKHIANTSADVNEAEDASALDLISAGESDNIEFKSTLRFNLFAKRNDESVTLACVKAICSFLNSGGGTLFIGVADDGQCLGMTEDRFVSEDEALRFLTSAVASHVSVEHAQEVVAYFEDVCEQRVMRVRCEKSSRPAYLKLKDVEKLYIRVGASSRELVLREAVSYIMRNFAEAG